MDTAFLLISGAGIDKKIQIIRIPVLEVASAQCSPAGEVKAGFQGLHFTQHCILERVQFI
jgi:hypothetical protein